MSKFKINFSFFLVLILISLYLFSDKTQSSLSVQSFNSARNSVVSGTNDVYYIRLIATITNTGNVPMHYIKIDKLNPFNISQSFLYNNYVSLSPTQSYTFQSELINITGYDNIILPVNLTITGAYFNSDGKLTNFTYYSKTTIPITQMQQEVKNIVIDFNTPTTTMKMDYCVQEAGFPIVFSENQWVQNNMRDVVGVGGYNRIWIKNGASWEDMMPINLDCTYNYTLLDKYVRATLNTGAIPHMSFTNAPYCLVKDIYSNISYSKFAVNSLYPTNLSKYVDVVEIPIVSHYVNMCTNGSITNCGNLNSWRWEIGNEPVQMANTINYSILFKYSSIGIKSVLPGAKVGTGAFDSTGASYVLLYQNLPTNIKPDFITYHNYGDMAVADSEFSTYRGWTFDMAVNNTKRDYKTETDNFISVIRQYDATVPVLNWEYNMDWHWQNQSGAIKTTKYIQTQEAAAWWASAMYWQMQTDLSGECFFVGTQTGFGMWYMNQTKKPSYYTRKDFVSMFNKGDPLYYGTPEDADVEVVAVQDGIAMINKKNKMIVLNLQLKNKNANYLIIDGKQYYLENNTLNYLIQPYKVIFTRFS